MPSTARNASGAAVASNSNMLSAVAAASCSSGTSTLALCASQVRRKMGSMWWPIRGQQARTTASSSCSEASSWHG